MSRTLAAIFTIVTLVGCYGDVGPPSIEAPSMRRADFTNVCGDVLKVDMATAERMYRAVMPSLESDPLDWEKLPLPERKAWLESVDRFLGDAACVL